ncbi:putative mitochondrial protein, partial [Mucuna pruriens]
MNNGIFVSQESYAKKVLEKFKMFDCNLVNTPMEGSLKLSKFDSGEKEDPTLFKSLVGSLRYLISIMPGIMYVVGVVCCFMEFPTFTHMKTTKRILYYLKGDVDDRKHTNGFVFLWVVVLLLGTLKSKSLLHFLLVKLSMRLQLLAH